LNLSRSVVLAVIAVLVVACSQASRAETPETPVASMQLQATVEVPTATPTAVPTPTPVPPTPTPVPKISRAPGEIVRGNTQRPEIALTFDCGASGVPTPAILAALRESHARVTFFITGQFATQYPELTRQIAAEHEIANHSWSHPDFAKLSNAQIVSEMQRGDEALNRIAGVNTKPLWRAPFGSRDSRILGVARENGWPYEIYWTADSGDWTNITPAQVRQNVSKAAGNGIIVVEHCGSTQTALVIGDILSDMAAKGLKVVTVSEILRD
jgi:peptidoglycan-N-acetylglucosamine deacetylase